MLLLSSAWAFRPDFGSLPRMGSPLQYPNLMATDSRVITSSAPLVAIAGWLLPGSGYFLIGQWGRAFGTGVTIILLFITGLLIAGVRVVEVPGFNVDTGEKQLITFMTEQVDPVTHRSRRVVSERRWALEVSVLGEIRDKPWSVPQVLTGPVAIVAGWCSIHAAAIDPSTGLRKGAITHAHISEIGSLYLSVAGLLNLMTIIDSAWRASQRNEQQRAVE